MLDDRILRLKEAAAFCGLKPSGWNGLVRAGIAPRPIQLGAAANSPRGWRLCDLRQWIASRMPAPAPAVPPSSAAIPDRLARARARAAEARRRKREAARPAGEQVTTEEVAAQ